VLAVEDRVTGADGRVVRSFVHFHPSVEVRLNGTRALATGPSASAYIETRNIRAARIVRGARGPDQGWYAPEFGMAVPAPVLELTAERVDQPFGYTIEMLK
jgi:hypothetical protein